MAIVRFNPYHALPVYSTLRDGLEFPFREGERVTLGLVFAYSIPVTSQRSSEYDMRNIDAKLQGIFYPHGRELGDDRIADVKRVLGLPRMRQLRFPIDENNFLQALIAAESETTSFPFGPGHVVVADMVVQRLRPEMPPSISTGATWTALLVPVGEEVNGLIVANVKEAEES